MNIAGYILLGAGVELISLNWFFFFSSIKKKKHISPVPVLPSVLMAAGLWQFEQTRPYWWAGFLADYGFWVLAIGLPRMLLDAWRVSIFTRVLLLCAEEPSRKFTLSLHRNGHFCLRGIFFPPTSCNDHGVRLQSTGAVGRWQETEDGELLLQKYWGERALVLKRTATGYVAHEKNYPESKEFAYDALDGLGFKTVS